MKKKSEKRVQYARLPKYNEFGRLVVEKIEITDDSPSNLLAIDMAKDFLRNFYNQQSGNSRHKYEDVMPVITQCFGKKSMCHMERVFWMELLEYARFGTIMEQFVSYAVHDCKVGLAPPDLSWIKLR